MELVRDTELDSLSRLEERIRMAAELVARLRRERDAAVKEKEAALAERGALLREMESLRGERQQVRTRVEKLLAQLDALGAG